MRNEYIRGRLGIPYIGQKIEGKRLGQLGNFRKILKGGDQTISRGMLQSREIRDRNRNKVEDIR